MTDFKMVLLTDITPDPNQPRKFYDETAMDELIDSILVKDVLQPILIRPDKKKGYQLVCGERRYRASVAVNKMSTEEIKQRVKDQPYVKPSGVIPAVIRELSDEEALELQIIENLQRKDVHAMEEAVAFKSLQDKRGWTATEIANRVGKKDHYVKQRLRLNDLTPEWQKVVYHNALNITDALKVAMLSPNDQKDLFTEEDITKEDLKNGGFKVNFNIWKLNKYKGELHSAGFDIQDPALIKKMGACTDCKYNTAAARLFPETDSIPRCTNITCFKEKTQKSFDIRLQEALTDPTMLFVNTDYTDHKSEIAKLIKAHTIEVLQYGTYNKLYAPEPPDFDEWMEDNADDYPNEKDRTIAWKKELEVYEKEKQDYELKITSGKFKKALVVVGDDKGQYIYLQVGKKKSQANATVKTAKQVQKEIKEGVAILQDVNAEIVRINENLDKAARLDKEKVHFRIMAEYKNHPALMGPAKGLTRVETIALHWFILEQLGWYSIDDEGYKDYELSEEMDFDTCVQEEWEKAWNHLAQLSPEHIAGLFRKLMAERFAGKSPRGYASEANEAFAIRKMAEALGDIPISAYEDEQKEVAEKRLKKAQKRLAELKELKKELEERAEVKKGTKPKAAKKNGK